MDRLPLHEDSAGEIQCEPDKFRKKPSKGTSERSVIALSDMQAGSKIIRILEKACAERSLREVFRDFMKITELTLVRLPHQFNAVAQTGRVEETDPPEIAEQWKKVADGYRNPRHAFSEFAEAFTFLLDCTVDEEGNPTYNDVLGQTFMQVLGQREAQASGQYYTPSSVAKMMAIMSCSDLEQEVKHRLKKAFEKAREKAPCLDALILAASVFSESDSIYPTILERLLPAITEFYEPVTICDPCVGSGVMLLAAASAIPRWCTQYNLVQYFGMDVSPDAVQMACLNCMLYGLNGFSYCMVDQPGQVSAISTRGGVWDVLEAPEPVLVALPEAAQKVLRGVREDPTVEVRAKARKRLREIEQPSFLNLEASPKLSTANMGNAQPQDQKGDSDLDEMPTAS